MAIPTITSGGPPLTETDIAKIEDKLGARFPAPYRKFLLAHNGGRPSPSSFGKDRIPSMLSFFGSVRARRDFEDLLYQHRENREYLPKEVIPIAHDQCGNNICLAIKGKNRGKVYFWDHEGAPEPSDIRAKYPEIIFNDYTESKRPPRPPTWPGYPDLTLIADSFDEFLQSFHEDEDGEDEQPEPPEDPDLALVDIDPDQFLPSIDEDEDDDGLDKPGKSAGKRTAPKTRKKPARSSSKKRTSKTTRPGKKR